MIDSFQIFFLLSHWFFILSLGFYLITNLQWYNYKIERVVFKHHRRLWHFIYFVIPLIIYFSASHYFSIFLYAAYIPSLYLWHRKLDKKLVVTNRVMRFFMILMGLVIFNDALCLLYGACEIYAVIMPLAFTFIISNALEKVLLQRYAKIAKDKLQKMDHLKIIAITASFGKTSLKNFLAQILASDFKVYATPRSVNTYAGIVRDVNESLSSFTNVYIIEAGAREKGDIHEIAQLIEHHYAILGKVGEQHIEYFKTLENIVETKLEIMDSPRLEKAFVFKDNPIPPQQKTKEMLFFPKDVRNINATLNGTEFEFKIDDNYHPFKTEILGAFNVINISAAITVAHYLGMSVEAIQQKVAQLKPIDHRLCKMEANKKIIIDDSFNGNLEGMLEGIRLSAYHEGRKVIVTPGLVESTEEANTQIAKAIDKTFDVAIITGELNSNILSKYIQKPQKIILKEKSNMQDILKASTQEGDLVLFANDAPNYV